MSSLKRLLRAVAGLFRGGSAERELDDELKFHIEMEVQANLRRGLDPAHARRQALRDFGGLERTKEECRDERPGRLLETLGRDLRYAARTLLSEPGFAGAAILTLALGIGANTLIFSVIDGVMLRPLPFEGGDRLIALHQVAPKADVQDVPFSVKEIEDYRDLTETLENLVEYHSMSFILLGGKEPERVQTGVVSANYFDVFKVKPLLGRTFLPGEDRPGAEPVLVLSHGYWVRSMGAARDVVGRAVKMNDRVHTVIGVLPPLPQYPDENDVYMPTSACPFRSDPRRVADRRSRMMSVFAKVKPGVSLDSVKADVGSVASLLSEEYPEFYPEKAGYGVTVTELHEELTRHAKPTLMILLGTVGLVLLLACANVANLSLARLLRRQRELAIRTALGAGTVRLLRQLLTESLLVSLTGGALGLLLASGGVDLLRRFLAPFTPRAEEISLNGGVLIFTAFISLATGLIFGTVPALASLRNLPSCFTEGSGRVAGGRSGLRLRSALVVAQVAVSLVLLVGAGLMIKSLHRLQSVDLGFNPERLLTMTIDLNWSKYNNSAKIWAFQDALMERVGRHPGVISAALAHTFPLDQMGRMQSSFLIQGRPLEEGQPLPRFDFRSVSPDYFETMGIDLVAGRVFKDSDRNGSTPVAVVNRSLAKRYWDQADPVGKMVSLDNGETWTQIVGVVGDVKQYGLDSEAVDEIYLPTAQSAVRYASLLVKTAADPRLVAREMKASVYAVDNEQPVANVQTLEELRGRWLSRPRLTTFLLALFALLALMITTAGVSGLIAYTVSLRSHEIGIRMALGASRTGIVRLVLTQGLTLAAVGLALGVTGSFLASRFLSGVLFEVEPRDPATLVAVSGILVAVAAAACLIPARRASSIDPMQALRTD